MHGYSGETILWDLRRPWLYILIGQYYQSNWLIIWICFRLNSECWWIAFFVLYCWPHASVSSKPHRDEGCGVGYNCLEGLLHAPAMLPLMLPEDSAIMSRASDAGGLVLGELRLQEIIRAIYFLILSFSLLFLGFLMKYISLLIIFDAADPYCTVDTDNLALLVSGFIFSLLYSE